MREKEAGGNSPMTDEQAMWLVQTNDDHTAFTALVKRWEQPIYRLCVRLTGDAHRGEDLKQETFSRVFAKRKEFQMGTKGAKFWTWLWRIALNLCYDELRRNQRRAKHLDSACELGEIPANARCERDTPDLRVIRQENCALVQRALWRLDEKVRTAIVLRYCEGMKLREIAEVLEVPEATVQSRIAAGLARLTKTLHPEFGAHETEGSPLKQNE